MADDPFFGHAGDLGDLIYALPTIRAAGGGTLYLFHKPGTTRVAMTRERVALVAPLLKLQQYIRGVEYSAQSRDTSLNGFRHHWKNGRNLADMHLATHGFGWEHRNSRWLEVDFADRRAPVIFHRSPRYRNGNFDWGRIYQTYKHCAAMVGTPEEHREFVRDVGPIRYLPTANFLELARVIAGCQLFVGNQSCPAAVAEGLKAPMILEVCPNPSNCIFDRFNRINAWDGKIELPPIKSDVVNVARWDTKNVGDMTSAAAYYLPIGGKFADPVDDPSIIAADAGDVAIIGGGGFFGHPAGDLLPQLLERRLRLVVVWGAGTNVHFKSDLVYPEWLERCAFVGVRDWGTPYRWVPCASCMSPLFDHAYKPTREAVAYRHDMDGLDGIPPLDLPTMTNGEASLERVLSFLGSAETVVTSSYHGAYWASLLGRKVIAVPFSSKFNAMKHPPTLVQADRVGDWRSIAKDCATHPDALGDCRDANLAFYDELRPQLRGE